MHPTLFELGPFALPTYGLLLAIGFVAGLALARRLAPRAGLEPAVVQQIASLVVLGGLLGSRVLYVVVSWQEFSDRPWEALFLWQGGLVWYGGVLGGIAVLLLLLRRYRVSGWELSDVLAPALSLGHAFGRLGCFAAGCCWGRPTDLPWSVVFPTGGLCGNPGVHLHPTQLYEAGGELILCAVLLWLWGRRRVSGQIFLTYLVLYSVLRSVTELFRGDAGRGFLFGGTLSTSQALSLLIAAAALGLLAWRLRGGRRSKEGPVPASLKRAGSP